MPFFTRPDFRLHYEVVEGLLPRDTLFLHGNLAANLWWEPALATLKKRGAHGPGRALLAEWRGCGQSLEFRGFGLRTLAEDMNALLGHLNVSAADIVGHSTGGIIALHALAQSPALYRSALLLDPVPPEGVRFGPEMRDAFERMGRDPEFCAAIILSTIHGGEVDSGLRQRVAEAAFRVAPSVWSGVPDMLHAPPALDLTRISHPVLVAHGEFDTVLPLQASLELSERLPHGVFEKLLGRGHCTNLEDPNLFVDLLGQL